MKSVIVFLILTQWTVGLSQDLELYTEAILKIKNTSEFSNFTANRTSKIQVMSEVIPFSRQAFIFQNDLKILTGVDYSVMWNFGEITEDKTLTKLSNKKKSKLKLFFSSIESELIIAELIYSRSAKDDHFNGIAMFTQSQSFLIQFKNGEVSILESTLMQYKHRTYIKNSSLELNLMFGSFLLSLF